MVPGFLSEQSRICYCFTSDTSLLSSPLLSAGNANRARELSARLLEESLFKYAAMPNDQLLEVFSTSTTGGECTLPYTTHPTSHTYTCRCFPHSVCVPLFTLPFLVLSRP